MAEIPVYGKGGVVVAHAIVDDDQAEALSQYRWHLSGGYVVRTRPRAEWPTLGQKESMHRAILGLSRGDAWQVDHINGNPLDNRCENLRITTLAQNGQNKRAKRGSTSRFRGVLKTSRQPDRWYAVVKIAGQKQKWLGHYPTEEEAAAVAAAYRAEHMSFATERAA